MTNSTYVKNQCLTYYNTSDLSYLFFFSMYAPDSFEKVLP